MSEAALFFVPVLLREPGAVLVALGQVVAFGGLEDCVLAARHGRAQDERLVARAAFRRVRHRAAAEHFFEHVVDPTMHLFRRIHVIFESASESAFQPNRRAIYKYQKYL